MTGFPSRRRWTWLVLGALAIALGLTRMAFHGRTPAKAGASQPPRDSVALEAPPDAIVVGAGIAGLSATYELARGGARVLVVDMASVFGGHAVMATGDLCLVDTPFQQAQGIQDSPELALKDLVAWGEDPNLPWARAYVEQSRTEIYDWIISLGVTFEKLVLPAGNSVPRTHRTKGRGIALVTPIFTDCAKRPNVTFAWHTKVDHLLTEGGRVVGIATTDARTDRKRDIRARAVVLATGGFQSNLQMVRASWPADLPFPDRLLVGSGINSMGSGDRMAAEVGAALVRMDHQWNYVTGMPDPRFADGTRGLNAVNPDSIWVNLDGKRFVVEKTSAKIALPILLRQREATYWSIFDEPAKHGFWIAGSDWASFDAIEAQIFSRPDLVKSAATVDELAARTGLDPAALRVTVERYNEMVATGVDTELGSFGPGKPRVPKRIATPPFYAVQFFPLSRKSMGGVSIDEAARVLDVQGHVVPGLFAAGEVTGLAGINGKAGLEGTFLGPSILTGRVAGRAALEMIGRKAEPPPVSPPATPLVDTELAAAVVTQTCQSCHPITVLAGLSRPGYWHFEKVHSVVLERKMDCPTCHAELGAGYVPGHHVIDRVAQTRACPRCHSGEDR